MKSKTKLILLLSSFCFVVAICLFSVFAVQNFSLVSGGSVEFVAPGVDATISAATLTGLSKKTGSGTMSSFTVTSNMSKEQIEDLAGYKTWSGIYLLFDDQSEGVGSISFTITNNGSKATQNILVKISTNTTATSVVYVTPCADFCVNPGTSHTFEIGVQVVNNEESVKLQDFEMVVELSVVKASNIALSTEYTSAGLVLDTNLTDKTAIITDGANMEGDVEIPAIVKDSNNVVYTVTEIADKAFYENATITSITIPDTVTTIGESSFTRCENLTSLVLGNRVTTIKAYAFLECYCLTSELILPNTVTTIADYAFSDSYIAGDLVIPNSVTTLGDHAFSWTAITSVVIGNGVEKIGDCAFCCCEMLNRFDLGNSVKIIGNNAFDECYGLSSIVIPDCVTTIGDGAFWECWNVKGELIIPDSVTTIGDQAFYFCDNLTRLVLGNSVTTIGARAFDECNGFTGELVIPNSVTTIGSRAFNLCIGLTRVVIPNGVTAIEDGVFSSCNSLTSVVIPNSVTTIGKGAFSHCSKLTSVVIPNSVTEIGENAFLSCSKLTSITINSVTPPTLGGTSCFDYTNDCDIYVPAGSENTYKSATNWSEYASRIKTIPA